jgi:acarbose 7IV-phosphotransferase
MASILVSGLTNIETNLRIERFPLDYYPVAYPCYGIRSNVSGVGYNLAKALTVLGDRVHFLSAVGPREEANAQVVRLALASDGIADEAVLPLLRETAQSVILYDGEGRRQSHTDLKDNREIVFPMEVFRMHSEDCDLLALCNINYSRTFLDEARGSGKSVACDVHVLANPYDDYNADFMRAADILFLSDEHLPEAPDAFARTLYSLYHNKIIVIGMGANGALLFEGRNSYVAHVPAVQTRAVVNTIGAGDALFSAFCHAFLKYGDSLKALRRAVVFASYKIGEAGAAQGFLDDAALEALASELFP